MLHKTITINSNIKNINVIVSRPLFVFKLEFIRIDCDANRKKNPNTIDTNNFKFSAFILENLEKFNNKL
jgi:hypothetical protein